MHTDQRNGAPRRECDSDCGAVFKDSIEALIAEAWEDILGVAVIERDADFFRHGGDSLQAARIISRLNSVCGVPLPLRALFDAPTVAELAAQIRAQNATQASSPAEQPASLDRAAIPTLSFSQERMWFMHALASASAAYHVPFAIRLRGHLDISSLRNALERVVARHEVLRTVFVSDDSGITPRVGASNVPPLAQVVLRPSDGNAVLDHVRSYLTEFTNQPFDLEKGPLLRGTLVEIAENDAVLLLVLHHIVVDQWSLDVLFRELALFYGEAVGGVRREPLPPPVSFTAYAHWQRQWFDQRRQQAELTYWKTKLAGLEPVSLNTDYPRPPQQTFRGAKLRLDFNSHEIAALTALGASHQGTLAMVLMTALKVLLHRHTASADIAIGVPIANRHHAASESLLGPLVNTLVLRTDLSGDPDFAAAIKRVRATALEAFAHQDTPFDLMVKELHLSRDASRSPLFSVLFNMLNTPLGELRLPGLAWSRFDFDKKAAQFDLTVTVDAAYDKSICFEYSQDLFTPATIRRLADHYMNLLGAALHTQSTPISEMSLMSAEERALIRGWSHGPAMARSELTIADLLKQTCERTPTSIALTTENRSFTYKELDAASTRVARKLQARGIGRGTRVGLCLTRSAPLITVLWGTIKAGAAYVSLDPSYPRERLAYMMHDAQLGLLIAERSLAQSLDWNRSVCPMMDIEEMLAMEYAEAAELNPKLSPRPEDPAYLIYTSGSTGQPKGVVIPHRAVVNFLSSMAREPGLSSDDRILAITTLSFDIAVLELLLPWSVGAQVILAKQEQATDGAWLHKLIQLHGATLMQATPSTWRILIDAGWKSSPALKALVGGEPLPPALASELLERCGEVWNMYGPTETTVWSTCWKVEAPESKGISLGQPIANTQVYVLDERRRLCPIGVPGEIYIGGAGVADGYFNRPQLTAERFVADSLAERLSSARLYRTGDQSRWRHDGALEHLGRLDGQVKVRGYRIELGEIEAKLNRHPNVSHALVTTREERAGDVRLIAYVVPNGSLPDPASLRGYLREWLPDYMLPQAFVTLESLPILPNGKTDLRRLPAPKQEAVAIEIVGPRTETEEALWKIWCKILGADRIGVHDNFFDLGGHSILSVQLVNRIRTDLRRTCALPMVFRYPTIAGLAAVLETATPVEDASLIALQPLGVEPPVFCICGIQLYQKLADCLAPNIPVYGVFVPMELDYMTYNQRSKQNLPCIERLATEYLHVIRAHQAHGPYRFVGFSFGGVLAYEMAQQLMRAGESVSFLALLDSDVPDRRGNTDSPRLHQRLRLLKKRVAERFKAQFNRFKGGLASDQALIKARDEWFVSAIRAYAAAPYPGPAVFIEAVYAEQYDPGYGWDALIRNLHTYQVPGDHLGILAPPNVDLLAENLRAHLETTPVV